MQYSRVKEDSKKPNHLEHINMFSKCIIDLFAHIMFKKIHISSHFVINSKNFRNDRKIIFTRIKLKNI